jgi:hypothetical protein
LTVFEPDENPLKWDETLLTLPVSGSILEKQVKSDILQVMNDGAYVIGDKLGKGACGIVKRLDTPQGDAYAAKLFKYTGNKDYANVKRVSC